MGWFSSSSKPSGRNVARGRDAPSDRGGRELSRHDERRSSRDNGERHRDDDGGAHSRHARGAERETRGERPRFSGSSAVARAKDFLLELTGHPSESVSSLTRGPDGGWRVRLEVVELERIPRTTDILASYEVQLDAHGELLTYERVARYYRNAAGGGDE